VKAWAPDRAVRAARRHVAAALAIVVAGSWATVCITDESARRLPRSAPLAELSYYPSGTWVREAALGDAVALADLLWLRAVQYYGEHRQTDNVFTRLAHVFEILTDLDPAFRNAYVFGGTSLCQEGKQFAAGVRLLEKGGRHNPKDWIYPFELGFVHYVGRRDLTRATFEFAQAARTPGAPELASRFAAWSGQRAGYEESAFELWQHVAATTQNRHLRDKACAHLRKLARGLGRGPRIEAWIGSQPPLPGEPAR
jgi:hypothetical protein